MSNMKLTGIELVRQLSLAFGPTGCEDNVADIIIDRVRDEVDSLRRDLMGNVIATMSFGDPKKRKKLMVSAHMDEVGFMVNDIGEDGLIRFGNVGGIDPSVLAGRKVILGDEREDSRVRGVIASKAIHHKEKEERGKPVKAKDLYIDIGAKDREECEKYVSVGSFGTFDSEFILFGKGGRTVKSKALDDRMCCAAMIEIIDSLRKDPPAVDLEVYFCFTVREEIGLSGAKTAAHKLAPDFAIVLETTAVGDIADTPEARRVAKLGDGVTLSVMDRSTIYDKGFLEFALSLSREKGIPAQVKKYVSGGNDAGSIHKSGVGVKALALSVPTRYLHSPACVASLDDYESVMKLTEAMIRNFSL